MLSGFVEALAKRVSGLLLLTATPEQAGIASHFDRLGLLDPDRFTGFDSFVREQQRFAEWNELIVGLQSGQRPSGLPEGIDSHAEPATQIRQLLDRYGTGRVLFRNTRANTGFSPAGLEYLSAAAPRTLQGQRDRTVPETGHSENDWLEADPRVAGWKANSGISNVKVLVIAAHAETALAPTLSSSARAYDVPPSMKG